MKNIPDNIRLSLTSGASTLCRCYTLKRKDGVTFATTDHDRDLLIDNICFEASSSFEVSTFDEKSNLAISGGEIRGALNSDKILEKEIEAGFFDGAELRIYLVNWQEPSLDFMLHMANFGEITRKDGKFIAEAQDLFSNYDQEKGRLFQRQCSAEFGDCCCKVDIETIPFRVEGEILELQNDNSFSSLVFQLAESGKFSRGKVTFTSGDNAGLTFMIKDHRYDGKIILWESFKIIPAVGDRFYAIVGCDKTFNSCRDIFNNALNFRGFPLIPTPDFVVQYARPGEGRHLGRPLVKL